MADLPLEFKRLFSIAAAQAGRALFPPLCGGCRRTVSLPATLCGSCWRELRLMERPWCEVLGVPFGVDMGEGALSPAAIANPPPFDRARSAVAYTGVARRMVQALKYNDRTDLAPWMARWMMRAGAELIRDADLIVPVPLHARRFLRRRFNQSAELARAIAGLSGLGFEPALVVRARPTRQQVGLGRVFRERVLDGVEATLLGLARLGIDVDLTCRILADNDDGDPRRDAGLGDELVRFLLDRSQDLFGDFLSVDHVRHAKLPVLYWNAGSLIRHFVPR